MKQLNAEKLNRILKERVEQDLYEARISCADIIVRQNGECAAHITAGSADASKGLPLPADSVFRLASLTKPVTAVAALIAIQNDWFSLNDKLESHLPEFANRKIAKKNSNSYYVDHDAKGFLTIRHLLTHTSGIMTEMDLGYRIWENGPKSAYESLESMTAFAASQPLDFEPGRFSAYSGLVPFDIIARLIELKSDMPFADFCKEKIFTPLGLEDMSFCPSEDQWVRMVKPHVRAEGKLMIPLDMGRHVFEGFPLSYTGGGAGLVSSARDYSRFAEMLLNGGTLGGTEILKPEIFALLPKIHVPTSTVGCDKNSGWGLGVRVVESADYHLPAGAFGWSGAYGCHFWVDPVNRITAVYMRSNLAYPERGKEDVKLVFEKDVMSCLDDR